MSEREVAAMIAAHLSEQWPWLQVDSLQAAVSRIETGMSSMDVLVTLYALRDANRIISEIAADVLELAATETTLTQKKLADALDIPPSTLRGLRKR